MNQSKPQYLVCHICAFENLEIIPAYSNFRRVTSDCQPWPAGGQLGICRKCGAVQKPDTEYWRTEIDQIYASYDIYHQSGGIEQAVFGQSSGTAMARSERLVQQIKAHVELPASGRALDVGCGNGAFLKALSTQCPKWSLAGTELTAKYKSIVEGINCVEALYTCPPIEVPGHFDLITLIHVLEHISSPEAFLKELRSKLVSDGLLMIQLPAFQENPFDLLIADHSTHFSAHVLKVLVERSGFRVIAVATDWVIKELSLVARKNDRSTISSQSDGRDDVISSFQAVECSLRWLTNLVKMALDLRSRKQLGIFGTSIAGTWLFQELAGQVEFFVDEDPSRAGKKYLGRPIYHPRNIPPKCDVILPLAPILARQVFERINRKGIDFHLPQ